MLNCRAQNKDYAGMNNAYGIVMFGDKGEGYMLFFDGNPQHYINNYLGNFAMPPEGTTAPKYMSNLYSEYLNLGYTYEEIFIHAINNKYLKGNHTLESLGINLVKFEIDSNGNMKESEKITLQNNGRAKSEKC